MFTQENLFWGEIAVEVNVRTMGTVLGAGSGGEDGPDEERRMGRMRGQ